MPGDTQAVRSSFNEAVDYFRQKVSVPSSHWTTIMDEANARAFAVAGATSDGLISDLRAAVDKSISRGGTLQMFQKDFDEIVKRRGWTHRGKAEWRARIIYQTNLSTAFAAGRYAQMTVPAVLESAPYWEYVHINCPFPRLQHLAWSGTILRADDPWWDTNYPPNGWGCHCMVMNLGPRQLARRGIDPDSLKAPPLQWMEYINRTTGVVTKYPAGIDPGFAYNPGKVWKEGAKEALKAPNVRPMAPPPAVLAPPGQNAVQPAVIKRFLDDPQGGIQVGRLSGPAQEHLGATTEPVVLPAGVVKQQLAEQPEVRQADYLAVEKLLAKPDLVLSEGPWQATFLGRLDDRVVAIAVDRAEDRDEIDITSVMVLDADTLRRWLHQHKIIAGDAAELLSGMDKQATQ